MILRLEQVYDMAIVWHREHKRMSRPNQDGAEFGLEHAVMEVQWASSLTKCILKTSWLFSCVVPISFFSLSLSVSIFNSPLPYKNKTSKTVKNATERVFCSYGVFIVQASTTSSVMQCAPFKDLQVHRALLTRFINDCLYKMLSNSRMNPLQPHLNAQPESGGVGWSVRHFAPAPKPKPIIQCKKVTFHDFITLYKLQL